MDALDSFDARSTDWTVVPAGAHDNFETRLTTADVSAWYWCGVGLVDKTNAAECLLIFVHLLFHLLFLLVFLVGIFNQLRFTLRNLEKDMMSEEMKKKLVRVNERQKIRKKKNTR